MKIHSLIVIGLYRELGRRCTWVMSLGGQVQTVATVMLRLCSESLCISAFTGVLQWLLTCCV